MRCPCEPCAESRHRSSGAPFVVRFEEWAFRHHFQIPEFIGSAADKRVAPFPLPGCTIVSYTQDSDT